MWHDLDDELGVEGRRQLDLGEAKGQAAFTEGLTDEEGPPGLRVTCAVLHKPTVTGRSRSASGPAKEQARCLSE